MRLPSAGDRGDLFAALQAAAAHPVPRLVSYSLPSQDVDCDRLFETGREVSEACLWSEPGSELTLLGLGRAWSVQVTGGERFLVMRRNWTKLAASALAIGPTPRKALAFGGFSFDPLRASGAKWRH